MSRRNGPSLEAIAHHEAGHAVASWSYGRRFKYATIVPDDEGGSLGHVRYAPYPKALADDIEVAMSPRARVFCEQSIICSLAGPAAERRLTGRQNHVGARGDYDRATDLALRICGNGESATAFLRWLEIRTGDLIDGHWRRIERLAAALLAHQRLDYEASANALASPGLAVAKPKKVRK